MAKYLMICCLSLAAILLNSCTPSAPTALKVAATQDIIVVGNGDRFTVEGCGPSEVAGLLLDFLDALNRGNREEIESFIGADFK